MTQESGPNNSSNEPIVVALVQDMIFSTKINSTAASLGVPIVVTTTTAGLVSAIAVKRPALVIVDLSLAHDEAVAAIAAVRDSHSNSHILGFVSHLDVDTTNRARAAGADTVLARSAFVRRLPDLLTQFARENSTD